MTLIATTIVVLVIAGAIFVKRTWVRASLVLFLYGCVLFSTTFGMEGVRASIEKARQKGKSSQYVEGIMARNSELLEARLAIILFSTGLTVLALGGWWAPLRGKRNKAP